jgi:4a-hydroxytetrahydrobiopterin dehydratase
MPTLIDAPLLDETLTALPGWQGDQSRIWREVSLPDEVDAELRRRVEVDATAAGHHPQVERTGDTTRFVLTTPEVGGVSELDVALASHISDLAYRLTDEVPEVEVVPGVEAVRDDEVDLDSGAGDGPVELHVQAEKVRPQVRF